MEGRPRQKDDWPQSNGSKRFPLHSHLWLPQPKPAAVHGIMFEGPAKELDKDWDTLWFHNTYRYIHNSLYVHIDIYIAILQYIYHLVGGFNPSEKY